MNAVATAPKLDHFLVDEATVRTRLHAIDPRAYDKTRNHLGGATTWLGPFLTHGVIACTDVAHAVLEQHRPKSAYRLLFELGWREFFHRTWQLEGDAIFEDMRGPQSGAPHERMPAALLDADTGIAAIDDTIAHLLAHGTMHNHARMWIASLACNLGATAWWEPARWLHHHLLDGDLASNTLSWQWVAGTFSDKRYLANQDNVNRFAGTDQHDTWLDVSYEELAHLDVPEPLVERRSTALSTTPPGVPLDDVQLTPRQPVALRSMWHLDPGWRDDIGQHLVFVDVDQLERWPLSPLRWRFIEHWCRACGATLAHGSIDALRARLEAVDVTRTEYPGCENWPGRVESRDWLYPMPEHAFPSFSSYWKQVKRSVGV